MIRLAGLEMPWWIAAPAIFLLVETVGWTIKAAAFKALEKIAQRTSTRFDDILIRSANFPLNLLVLVTAVAVSSSIVVPQLHDVKVKGAVEVSLRASLIIAAVVFLDRFLRELLSVYSSRVALLRVSAGFAPVITRVLVVTIGALIFLDTLGVSVAPIIASLGIGSLAVALALQPTLENVFSGFQILVDKPILPGQFVKLESGEEGYVEQIGWRTTWIRQLSNNMVVVPNKQIVSSRLVNFYYPSKELAVLVDLGVHYSSDLEKVERVTIEVAREVMRRVKGAIPDFEPFIRFHTFGDSSINFSVIMRGQEFTDNYLIKHEFIKALAARYSKEGIVIPYPIRAINTTQEKAEVAPALS